MTTLEPVYLENAIDKNSIEYLKSIFYKEPFSKAKLPNNMISIRLPAHIEFIANLIDVAVENITTAHFYKHTEPLYPHTDYHDKEITNIVMPLEVADDSKPHLVIFDQYWNSSGNTWTFNNKSARFQANKELLGRPCDYDILNATEKDIDENLYEHLNHQPKEAWFSLSGTAYPFKPGSLLKFDAKSIHATGKMTCESKLGLTIRLDIPFK